MSLKNYMLAATFLVSSLAASSAFAQNNNTGQIVVQGVVPGTWEVTVQDINAGYDFNLETSVAAADAEARVGTIHLFTNEISDAGGTLYIESANAGRLINNNTIPGIAGEHLAYTMYLTQNALVTSAVAPDTTALPTQAAAHNLLVPYETHFAGSGAIAEITYDVHLILPGTERPQASGVYTDTITITVMDDN